jgi:formamidopyrimidine-DNA glycosylase
VRDARALKRHPGSAQNFASTLSGARIESAVRRGKFVWCPLDTGDALVIHLGMSGQIRVVDGEPIRHERVRLVLDGQSPVAFVDQRLFGSLAIDSLVEVVDGRPAGLGSESTRIPSSVTHIARDILDPALNLEALVAAFRKRTTGVKIALLNQNLVSGIGNIYADEALWAAGIHYATPADSIRPIDYRRLFDAVQSVMSTALVAGGTSFDALYVNVNGESGYFDLSLNAYGQAGKPCARCDALIVREPWQNRSSHFCPRCQRAVRRRR